jgi:hypothetical protein
MAGMAIVLAIAAMVRRLSVVFMDTSEMSCWQHILMNASDRDVSVPMIRRPQPTSAVKLYHDHNFSDDMENDFMAFISRTEVTGIQSFDVREK